MPISASIGKAEISLGFIDAGTNSVVVLQIAVRDVLLFAPRDGFDLVFSYADSDSTRALASRLGAGGGEYKSEHSN